MLSMFTVASVWLGLSVISTIKTIIFIFVAIVTFIAMPAITARLTKVYGHRTAAIRTKWILFVLFALGALTLWSGSEAVLPAYILGMVLASSVARDEFFTRRLQTLTIGFLTPIYFLQAGYVVPTLIANSFFLPEHLLEVPMADEEIPQLDGLNGGNNH